LYGLNLVGATVRSEWQLPQNFTKMVQHCWIVIGAGPSGITAIGALLDLHQTDIIWIDPEFNVGDLSKYPQVPGNTLIRLLEHSFFEQCASFQYNSFRNEFPLAKLGRNDYCMLKPVADIFQRISRKFEHDLNLVCVREMVTSLKKQGTTWQVTTNNQQFLTEKVILANGARPIIPKLPFTVTQTVIPVVDALTPTILKSHQLTRVAVFGASHTAILVMKNLIDMGIPVLNIFKSPILFAKINDDGLENWYTGLKGVAADWAKNNIVQDLNPLLERVHLEQLMLEGSLILEGCSHVVYGVGFETNPIPGFVPSERTENGMIQDGVMGIGIAYPGTETDCKGKKEFAIGFVPCLKALQKDLERWINQESE
jgi:hypothetical protein